ncbi:MAG TPA: class I SAM-dependent methyltransferase [Nevskiaceae bacterium]
MNDQPRTEDVWPIADAAPASACTGALSGIMDTLRIPLAARAWGSRLFPEFVVHDETAARLLDSLEDDGSLWLDDRHTVYSVLMRTRIFRRLARRYLHEHPGGHVLNLGCGLSNYFQWLDNGRCRLTDVDLPEVIELRQRLMPPACERHALAAIDLRSRGWWRRAGFHLWPTEQPVFLFGEAVLVYLQPREVVAVLAEFAEEAAPGSIFALDAANWLAVGGAWAHPSVRHLDAEFTWGVRSPLDLTWPHPRLRLAATHEIMESYGWPYSVLGPVTTLMTGVPMYAVYELQLRDA